MIAGRQKNVEAGQTVFLRIFRPIGQEFGKFLSRELNWLSCWRPADKSLEKKPPQRLSKRGDFLVD